MSGKITRTRASSLLSVYSATVLFSFYSLCIVHVSSSRISHTSHWLVAQQAWHCCMVYQIIIGGQRHLIILHHSKITKSSLSLPYLLSKCPACCSWKGIHKSLDSGKGWRKHTDYCCLYFNFNPELQREFCSLPLCLTGLRWQKLKHKVEVCKLIPAYCNATINNDMWFLKNDKSETSDKLDGSWTIVSLKHHCSNDKAVEIKTM